METQITNFSFEQAMKTALPAPKIDTMQIISGNNLKLPAGWGWYIVGGVLGILLFQVINRKHETCKNTLQENHEHPKTKTSTPNAATSSDQTASAPEHPFPNSPAYQQSWRNAE